MSPLQAETVTPQQQVARVAAMPQVHAAFAWFRSHEREISDRQLEMVRIPAPPFGEHKRAEWLQQQFIAAGLEHVHVDEIGNVLGMRRGTDSSAKYVALSAHIDTVFPADVPLKNVRREGDRLYGPGISDNGAGVAALLAIAHALQAAEVRTTAPILFIGNVGEEGEGDLRGMRQVFNDAVLRDSIASVLVIDGAGTDTLVTQALGSRRFEVTISGPGGHSWSDFGTPNPIVVLARAIDAFSRTEIPANPKTTYNVGVISGGTSVNSIPENATIRVDIRSSSGDEIDKVEQALRRAVADAVQQSNAAAPQRNGSPMIAADVKLIGSRPAAELPDTSPLLQLMRAVDAHLNNPSRIHRASTDANVPISLGRDALAIGAGGTGGGAHTLHEWYDPRGRDLGLKRILLALVAMAS